MISVVSDRWLARGAVSTRHGRYLRALRLRRIRVVVAQGLILVGFFAAWQWAANARVIDPFITSEPRAVLRSLLELFGEGSLFVHIGITVWEALLGFVLGTILGVALAAVLWWWPFVSDVADPYLVVLNATPKIALAPLFLMWLGISLKAVVALAVSITLFVTILNVYSAFRQVDREKLILVITFGASRWQQFRKVVLPASVPTMVATLKVNVGLSLIGAIVGEFLGAQAGLGYLIIYGKTIFSMSLVMTSLVILSAIAGLMYLGVYVLEHRFVRGAQR